MRKATAAWTVFWASVTLDIIFGLLFAVAEHVSIGDGLYFATTTASTVGYGDITPRGWAPHLIAVAIMLTVIPMFSAVFSLLTTALTTKHVDSRHEELKAHLDRQHEALKRHVSEVHSGRPGSNQGLNSRSGNCQRASGAEHVGGVPRHDQPADAPGNPEAAGS